MQARLLAAACFGQIRTSGYGSSGAAAEPLLDVAEGLGCLRTGNVDRIAQAEPELGEWQQEDQNAHDREQHALHSEPPLRELVEARRNRLGRKQGKKETKYSHWHHDGARVGRTCIHDLVDIASAPRSRSCARMLSFSRRKAPATFNEYPPTLE